MSLYHFELIVDKKTCVFMNENNHEPLEMAEGTLYVVSD